MRVQGNIKNFFLASFSFFSSLNYFFDLSAVRIISQQGNIHRWDNNFLVFFLKNIVWCIVSFGSTGSFFFLLSHCQNDAPLHCSDESQNSFEQHTQKKILIAQRPDMFVISRFCAAGRKKLDLEKPILGL